MRTFQSREIRELASLIRVEGVATSSCVPGDPGKIILPDLALVLVVRGNGTIGTYDLQRAWVNSQPFTAEGKVAFGRGWMGRVVGWLLAHLPEVHGDATRAPTPQVTPVTVGSAQPAEPAQPAAPKPTRIPRLSDEKVREILTYAKHFSAREVAQAFDLGHSRVERVITGYHCTYKDRYELVYRGFDDLRREVLDARDAAKLPDDFVFRSLRRRLAGQVLGLPVEGTLPEYNAR